MSEFDPQDQQTQETTSSQAKQSKSNRNMISMFISGLAGGLIVALFSAGIFLAFFNNQDGESATNQDQSEDTQTEIDQGEDVVQTANVNSDGESSVSQNEAIQSVSDAVVGVSNIQQTSLWEQSEGQGTGSGVIYKKEGDYAYVVTNHHVVEGAQELEVILPNEEHITAKLLGSDQLTDLAVLRIPSDQVDAVAPLGSSADLGVGDTAIAIGNPLGTKFAGSVTKGIISGLERSVNVDLNGDSQPDWTTEVIQTDAAINLVTVAER
ncbi:HtrA family serine protease [Gracilibacillus halophilus YIM-C55.5]|uniref:HtrA family serine protease n=1 Tax=Gracilibacillus halophilus YIM-C55.5 TaxID=1308866 RepID=N4WT74_9BACI|nr:S1C family serine protease [Gracilibacillus halophilus]ENH96371.1 HtrA family serine protease [Gracilibacillus halophilus YIM-C55.5]